MHGSNLPSSIFLTSNHTDYRHHASQQRHPSSGTAVTATPVIGGHHAEGAAHESPGTHQGTMAMMICSQLSWSTDRTPAHSMKDHARAQCRARMKSFLLAQQFRRHVPRAVVVIKFFSCCDRHAFIPNARHESTTGSSARSKKHTYHRSSEQHIMSCCKSPAEDLFAMCLTCLSLPSPRDRVATSSTST